MFKVSDTDYVPVGDYIFGWRWIDKDRVEISDERLARIRPLTKERAEAAWDYSKSFQGIAYSERFLEIDEYHVDGRGDPGRDGAVRDWLTKCLDQEAERVFISWTKQQAVETDLSTFIKFWNTFCYPVEDVVIWPASESWVLLFDYKQRFYHAVERAEAEPLT